jgi:hypothetical protein
MEFSGPLVPSGRTATGIEVPAEVLEHLGGGKRPAVTATLRGPGGAPAHTVRLTLGVMGGRTWIPVSAANRSAAGLTAGDEVRVAVELDTEPRELEVPQDLQTALDAAAADARTAFASLSPSRQRAVVDRITTAKQAETRARRVAQTVEELLGGGQR